MSDIDRAYKIAISVLEKCSTKNGFFAAYPGYDMVFARDSMIISIGASFIDDEKLKKTFKHSLITLADNQSVKGQIPNAVDLYSKRKGHVDYKSIDSTLWFLIGNKIYAKRYNDKSLLNKYNKNIENALTWLSFQDIGEDYMLEQQPTTDWQDAFPHRYGHTINTQSLYYHVLNLYGKMKEAFKLKKAVNENKDDKLWNGNFYLAYRWKNHNKYKEMGNWFDSLGNLMAVIYGLADNKKSIKILDYIRDKKINTPFPVKSIYPPITKNHPDWKDYYLDCEAGKPFHYLNGGIWTFIGGFYVCALIKMEKFEEAEKQLKKLAEANLKKPYFNEWLNGKTGNVGKSGSGVNGNQGWNAGMFITAYNSVKQKKCLV